MVVQTLRTLTTLTRLPRIITLVAELTVDDCVRKDYQEIVLSCVTLLTNGNQELYKTSATALARK